MEIRKQQFDLTLSDLDQFPVWERALDEEGEPGQDEETLRPLEHTLPLDCPTSNLIVRARFVLADGTPTRGYLTPDYDAFGSRLCICQPHIITTKGHVGFWFGGIPPREQDKHRIYEMLNKDRDAVFPIRFESDIALAPGVISGSIEGILSFARGRVHSIQNHPIVVEF